MKKFIAVPAALVATALSLTACGGASHTTTATKAASKQPVATHPTQLKTDMVLCTTIKGDLTEFGSDAKSMTSMSDAAVESYITSTMLPKLQHVQAETSQLASEATTASDKQRIGALQQGLSTIYGGLTDLSTGDTTGISMLSQGMGQISAASGATGIAICGSQPTGV
jgi:hypothetical protein